ncbi:hypothetical protein BKM20_27455 [Pseudomonas avellanae]|uniref:Uncharacterized protein n=2 Tax=Pseudomonas avellanae TaxID=46257 RepID=A0AAD0DU64_9PSED|nr:hypothetical protein BKM03_01015 [Pseudomonas avellanae]KWS59764.1 hypothetical protein AL055_02975 [Pseudomonas amygdali pv. morsprunorum]PHN34793.1 hypothetical protein AO261_16740 [Pseudomonas avellanae]POC82216.1 hypothetical protein BKM26_27250 [Pseudomonas avellanae]POC99563.1 hypothetical protein BKM20_27455 [Pseudomonas avellanae]
MIIVAHATSPSVIPEPPLKTRLHGGQIVLQGQWPGRFRQRQNLFLCPQHLVKFALPLGFPAFFPKPNMFSPSQK